MKFAILFIVAFSVVVTNCDNRSRYIQWGVGNWNDTRAYYNVIKEPSKFFQVITLLVEYPPKGIINYRPISVIRVTDQKANGNGGYASILSGGVNATNVVIRLKSQRNHGINFFVEIFTR